MRVDVWMRLEKDQKMSKYLEENSQWYKYLNRNPLNYNNFVKAMKEQYKIRTTDKITGFMDNIDTISSILNVLK